MMPGVKMMQTPMKLFGRLKQRNSKSKNRSSGRNVAQEESLDHTSTTTTASREGRPRRSVTPGRLPRSRRWSIERYQSKSRARSAKGARSKNLPSDADAGNASRGMILKQSKLSSSNMIHRSDISTEPTPTKSNKSVAGTKENETEETLPVKAVTVEYPVIENPIKSVVVLGSSRSLFTSEAESTSEQLIEQVETDTSGEVPPIVDCVAEQLDPCSSPVLERHIEEEPPRDENPIRSAVLLARSSESGFISILKTDDTISLKKTQSLSTSFASVPKQSVSTPPVERARSKSIAVMQSSDHAEKSVSFDQLMHSQTDSTSTGTCSFDDEDDESIYSYQSESPATILNAVESGSMNRYVSSASLLSARYTAALEAASTPYSTKFLSNPVCFFKEWTAKHDAAVEAFAIDIVEGEFDFFSSPTSTTASSPFSCPGKNHPPILN